MIKLENRTLFDKLPKIVGKIIEKNYDLITLHMLSSYNTTYQIYCLRPVNNIPFKKNLYLLYPHSGINNSCKLVDLDNATMSTWYGSLDASPTNYSLDDDHISHLCDVIYRLFYVDEKENKVNHLATVKHAGAETYRVMLGSNILTINAERQNDVKIELACGRSIYKVFTHGVSTWKEVG